MSKIAHILALRASSIAGWAGLGFGIRPLDDAGRNAIFANSEVWSGPRPVLETLPEFVQPIPYIVVKDGEKILSYIRSPKGGEDRLHNKVAVGFGGHVDLADATINDAGQIDLQATLATGALRELKEELGIELDPSILDTYPDLLAYTHVIHSKATAVDEVHIGFVVTVDLSALPSADFQFEDAIGKTHQLTAAELAARFTADGDELLEPETWTRLVIENLLEDERLAA